MTESQPVVESLKSGGPQPLYPAIKLVWAIGFGIWTAVLVAGVFSYEIVQFVGRGERLLPFGVLTFLTLVVGGALSLLVPRFRYRYWRYELRAEELYLEKGIFNRIRTIVPLRRIQHLDVSQNLIEREFGLAKLIVHTAGTRSSDVVLPGLRMEVAEQLHDEVKVYILEDTL